mmetsp:Transcript_6902/g.9144  ORF Transcript_6902/g.9144 Transcript_6902/m.9144 type:complete len:196 (-) Transcript_6902:198-785(-)
MYNIRSLLLSLSLFVSIFFLSDAAEKRQLTKGKGSKQGKGSMRGKGSMKRTNRLTVNFDLAIGDNFKEFRLPVIDDSTPTVGDRIIRRAFLREGDESSGRVIGELVNLLTIVDVMEDGVGQTFQVDGTITFDSDDLEGAISISALFSVPFTLTGGPVFAVRITGGSGDLAGANGFYETTPDPANGIGIIDLTFFV